MTLLYLKWEAEERKLKYSSAGHEHIIIYRKQIPGTGHRILEKKSNSISAKPSALATSHVEVIRSGGFVLGVMPEINQFLEDRELSLDSQDKVVLYTDGVTEARNEEGEMFGLERLIRFIEKYGNKPVRELINSIKQELYNFIGNCEVYDDITLVVMEITSE